MRTRWLGFSLVLLGAAALSSCTTLVAVAINAMESPPRVPLTSGLPWETVKLGAAFDMKVKARFPIGTLVSEMGEELRKEKFVREDWSDLPGSEHFAERYDGGAPGCNLSARVIWKSDANARLSAIRGEYSATCL